MSNQELFNKISNIKLTKKQKIIAEYFLEEHTNIYLMTSTEIAEKLDVSDTSILRFVKHLGYKSFTEFKNSGQNNIKNYLSKTDSFIEKVDILKENSIEQLYLENIKNNINFLFAQKSIKELKKICSLIIKKRNKYVVGFKSTAGLANFFGIRLGFMLKDVRVYNIDDSVVVNSVADIKKDDILILFDYPMYSKTAEVIAKIAKNKKVTIILFTSSSNAPTAEYADIIYKLKMDGISLFNSLISSQIAIELILSYISKTLSEEYKERFSQIKKSLVDKL